MSIEQSIGELTAAVNKLTAAFLSGAADAAMSKSPEVETAPAKGKAAAPAKGKAAAPADDDLDLDELGGDTPEEDDLGLDDLDEEEAAPEIDKAALQEAFKTLAKKAGGREAVQDLFKKLKVSTFGDLKPAQYASAHAEAVKATKALK